jgi:hypothetical protein
MRYKENIIKKIIRIESSLSKLNYSIGTNDREVSYKHLDSLKENISDILTLLNREEQD